MMSNSEFDALVRAQSWGELLDKSRTLLSVDPESAVGLHFQGLAYLRLGEYLLAEDALTKSLHFNRNNRWCIFLQAEARKKSGKIESAIGGLEAYLSSHPRDEEAKALIVNHLVELELFREAITWNKRRSVIADSCLYARSAVVVQTFIKMDTLDELFSSLMQQSCNLAEFDLIIAQDSLSGSRKFSERHREHAETKRVISEWIPQLSEAFNNVVFRANKVNRGTTATCKITLDYAAHHHGELFFFEDDCILSTNALHWMSAGLRHVNLSGPLFVGGESIFFDTRGQTLSDEKLLRWMNASKKNELRNAFIHADFVPSTCFSTTATNWKRASDVRGFPLGDIHMNKFLRSEGVKPLSLLPVVPRVKDIGMQHELGYSVAHHGQQSIKEIKSTKILSDCPVIDEEMRLVLQGSDLLSELR
jgi:tetratricopeptide (TPR) repeat protein